VDLIIVVDKEMVYGDDLICVLWIVGEIAWGDWQGKVDERPEEFREGREERYQQ
jgi:hypothetical protein